MPYRLKAVGHDIDGPEADGSPSQRVIAVAGVHFYWVDSRFRFRRAILNDDNTFSNVKEIDGPESNGKPSQVIIAVEGDWIYWVDSKHRFRRGKLDSEGRLSGNSVVQNIDGPEADGSPSQVAIAVDGEYIYWVDSKHRFRRGRLNADNNLTSVVNLDGPEEDGSPSQVLIAVEGEWIYWVDSKHRFRRGKLDSEGKLSGNSVVHTFDGPEANGKPSQVAIAVNGNWIYWVDSKGRLRKGIIEEYEPEPEVRGVDLGDYLRVELREADSTFAIRIGNPVLSHEISKLPTFYQTNTDYNKRKAYDFSYAGLDTSRDEIRIKFKFNFRKYEEYPWPARGRYQTYNQTWRVEGGLAFSVNRNHEYELSQRVISVESGFPGGVFGWVVGIFDVEWRIIGWIVDGRDPGNFTDTIISIMSNIAISDLDVDVDKYYANVKRLASLRRSGAIFPKGIDSDEKGLWLEFGYDLEKVALEVLREIIDAINP